ncbi:glycerophosphodiester phosphodiesterase [Peribacillus alkalitolerans]|uniref:glycerophosphodiester phosphodiesterase n=1 Tax=Peribacillus alkalitolerans TaxID=1550385 RepID=UPI0013D5A82B|nr:glycerophosphodiester phosphodiesterase [Peribacillus alkalitolerans]
MNTTMVFAHRGSAGTHPENTMLSFREAERVGADGIELDIQLTKDNQIVVIHDETIDRTTNGKGFVKDYTVMKLKQFNASFSFTSKWGESSIPTLEEVLQWMQGNRLRLIIELKNTRFLYPGMEEKAITMVRKYSMQDRVILTSFNHYSLVYCTQLSPDIETAPLYRDGLFMPWIYAQSIRAGSIHPSIKVAPDNIIKMAMDAGIKVRPYTINDANQMKALFDIGCSGIITDYPKKAIDLRKKL